MGLLKLLGGGGASLHPYSTPGVVLFRCALFCSHTPPYTPGT